MNRSLRNKYGILKGEEEQYALPTKLDYKILSIVKELEAKSLTREDRETVALIKTQLLDDWRTPLVEKLEQIKQRYS